MNAAEIPSTEQRLLASAMHMGCEQLHKQTDAAMRPEACGAEAPRTAGTQKDGMLLAKRADAKSPRLLCTKNSQKQPLEECKGGPDENQKVTKFEVLCVSVWHGM